MPYPLIHHHNLRTLSALLHRRHTNVGIGYKVLGAESSNMHVFPRDIELVIGLFFASRTFISYGNILPVYD